MIVGFIIDAINLRNKKMQIQIITSKDHMAEIIIANFPHSATLTDGKGAYSGQAKTIIWMVQCTNPCKYACNATKKSFSYLHNNLRDKVTFVLYIN